MKQSIIEDPRRRKSILYLSIYKLYYIKVYNPFYALLIDLDEQLTM